MVLVTVPWIVLFLNLNLVVLFAEIVKRENLELVMVKANVLFKSQKSFLFSRSKKKRNEVNKLISFKEFYFFPKINLLKNESYNK